MAAAGFTVSLTSSRANGPGGSREVHAMMHPSRTCRSTNGVPSARPKAEPIDRSRSCAETVCANSMCRSRPARLTEIARWPCPCGCKPTVDTSGAAATSGSIDPHHSILPISSSPAGGGGLRGDWPRSAQ